MRQCIGWTHVHVLHSLFGTVIVIETVELKILIPVYKYDVDG